MPHSSSPEALASHASDAQSLPAFPKPANVLAAEERAAARQAGMGKVHGITSQAELDEKCYKLEGKTCALFLLPGGAEKVTEGITSVAKKYHKDGFSFAAVDVDTATPSFIEGLLLGASPTYPALAVVSPSPRLLPPRAPPPL